MLYAFTYSSGDQTLTGSVDVSAVTTGAVALGAANYGYAGTLVSPGGLKTAVANAAAGATLVLRGGTYSEQVSIAKALTIQNYPGEQVTLDGKGTMTWALIIKAKVNLYGIRIRNFITPAPGTFEYGVLIPSGSDGTVIENCIFEDMLGSEARVGRSALYVYSNKNVTVRSCTFQRNAQNHMTTSNTTNMVITNCRFVDCNQAGQQMAPVTSATKHLFANGLAITNNTFDGAPGCSGVWLDGNCYNFTINDNTFTRMGVEGIQAETSGYGQICRNTVRGNSIYGIRLFDANDITVDSNDIDGPTVWHIGIMQDERRAANDPNAGYTPPGQTWATHNISFTNNLCGPNAGVYQMYAFDQKTNIPAEAMFTKIEGNTLTKPIKGSMVGWGRGDNNTRQALTPEQLNTTYPAIARSNTSA